MSLISRLDDAARGNAKSITVGVRHGSDKLPVFEAYDPNHVPYNKLRGRVHQCSAKLMVATHAERKYCEIFLQEVEQYESGRFVTRVHGMTLSPEEAKPLAKWFRDNYPAE